MPVYVLTDNSGAGNIAGVRDTFLEEGSPTATKGTQALLRTSKYGGAGTAEHSLIAFDGMSSIPAGETVTGADLELNLEVGDAVGGTTTISVKRLLSSWVENEATWNARNAVPNAWATAGATGAGDRDSTDLATLAVNATPGYKLWSSAGLIAWAQGVIDGSIVNHGFHLERTDGAGDLRYRDWYSSEAADGVRPRLTITTTVGSPWNGTGTGPRSDGSMSSGPMVLGALGFTNRSTFVPSAGLAKVWNGSAWVAKPAKYWNGSVWTQKPAKHWNGSAWQ